ncbi:hypothetical protein VTO42DRAFT_1440 [Malbranchea cinnamomea]
MEKVKSAHRRHHALEKQYLETPKLQWRLCVSIGWLACVGPPLTTCKERFDPELQESSPEGFTIGCFKVLLLFLAPYRRVLRLWIGSADDAVGCSGTRVQILMLQQGSSLDSRIHDAKPLVISSTHRAPPLIYPQGDDQKSHLAAKGYGPGEVEINLNAGPDGRMAVAHYFHQRSVRQSDGGATTHSPRVKLDVLGFLAPHLSRQRGTNGLQAVQISSWTSRPMPSW